MSSRRPRIVLATDSVDPSGMGEHMLTLGRALNNKFDVTIAAYDEAGLLLRAAGLGLAIKAIDREEAFAHWLGASATSLLHVHAGIGWEGHGIAREVWHVASRSCARSICPILLRIPFKVPTTTVNVPALPTVSSFPTHPVRVSKQTTLLPKG